jgi:hypothetical protein
MESVAPTEPESQESDVVETPEPQPEQVEANDPAPAVVVEESVMPEPETVVPPTRIQKPSEFLLPNPGLGASNETYEKPQEKKSAPVKTRSELLKDIMAGKNRK